MIVVLIRTLRPYVPVVGALVWLLARLWFPLQDFSLLEELCRTLQFAKAYSLSLASGSFGATVYLPLLQWMWHALEDFLAMACVATLGRMVYCIYHTSPREFQNLATDTIFHWTLDHVPGMEAKFDDMASKIMQDANTDSIIGKAEEDKEDKETSNNNNDSSIRTELPAKGWGPEAVIQELQPHAQQENDKWTHGKLSGTVYQGDPQHSQLMAESFKLYTWANPLHIGYWPKMNQCGAEVIAMTSRLLNAPNPYGAMTSGGTESIFLAIKASSIYYGQRRGISRPELICGTSAHAAVDKACELLGIRQIRVDCSQGDCRLDPLAVKAKITSNTILIYASAPCFPQGVIDPVEELSELALQYNIGLHVDACLGGFVLAFWEDAPKYDFLCPGVTSMSVDNHKYGYAAKGTSVVVYRHKKLRHAQYFCYSKWSGGLYATPTLAGSRPGALEVCAWASMMSIGHDGYKERVQQITTAAKRIAKGIDQDIPGLNLRTVNPSMVVCFDCSDETMDIYSIGARLLKKGWTLNELQTPASLHLCVTLNVAPKADVFLKELKEAVEEERLESRNGPKKRGSAGIYGMAGAIPEGPVKNILMEYVDVMLSK